MQVTYIYSTTVLVILIVTTRPLHLMSYRIEILREVIFLYCNGEFNVLCVLGFTLHYAISILATRFGK